MKGYLSTTHAAKYADVHPQTIRQWVRCGYLNEYRAGKHLRIKVAELDEYLGRGVPGSQSSVDERVLELVP